MSRRLMNLDVSAGVELRATNVTVVPDRGSRKILDGASVTILPGRVHAIVGPNGAGKSTLFSVLAGDTVPTEGSASLGGHPLATIDQRELARLRAVLMQQNAVNFSFTAIDVVEMGRAPWARYSDAATDTAAVASAMAMTDVVHLADRSVMSLSGGERARVALARVLAQRAPVMLWDEPTAALDLRHQEDVMAIARERATAGDAIAVVLHDLGAALAHADDVTLLSRGRVVATGRPLEVLTPERIAEVYGQEVDVFPHPITGAPLLVPRR